VHTQAQSPKQIRAVEMGSKNLGFFVVVKTSSPNFTFLEKP